MMVVLNNKSINQPDTRAFLQSSARQRHQECQLGYRCNTSPSVISTLATASWVTSKLPSALFLKSPSLRSTTSEYPLDIEGLLDSPSTQATFLIASENLARDIGHVDRNSGRMLPVRVEKLSPSDSRRSQLGRSDLKPRNQSTTCTGHRKIDTFSTCVCYMAAENT